MTRAAKIQPSPKKREPKTRGVVIGRGTTSVQFVAGNAVITIERLEAEDAAIALQMVIEAVRKMQRHYPELRAYHPTTGGYMPTEVTDDDWQDDSKHQVGFR